MKHIFTFAFAIICFSVSAQWNFNTNINNAITTATGYQGAPAITSDGAGGAIITWYSNVSGTQNTIVAQRIDVNGNTMWTSGGVTICAAAGFRYFPQIISDGNGGAVIAWGDQRNGNYDVYAQRINAAGVVQWTTDGVPVAVTTNDQNGPDLIQLADGSFVISWFDYRGGSTSDIYAQRFDANGSAQWAANGVVVCNASSFQFYPDLATDASNNTIITWQDERSGNYNIYAQKIDVSGTAQWTANGVAICTASGIQGDAKILADGTGGAYIVWEDGRGGTTTDIYAAKISATGTVPWTANGVAVATATNYQEDPQLIADGSGGCIITWMDLRNSIDFSNRDIYAQRLDGNGAAVWTSNGIAICNNNSDQRYPNIISDNNSGAIITWMDKRNVNQDIYIQKVNSAGNVVWTANGVVVCNATGNQDNPKLIADNSNGAIVVWNDPRNTAMTDNDIYASRVFNTGTLPVAFASFDGNAAANCNTLVWQTANEINNAGFEIEKSKDGLHFVKLDFVASKGNSNNNQTYNYTDCTPFVKTYYRIKQIDIVGQFQYSTTLLLQQKSDKKLTVYPNPATQSITVSTNFIEGAIQIINSYGIKVKQVAITGNQTILNIATLPNGYYYCQVGNETTTFIKLK